jgi:glycerol-3-phosphate dehydrogenase
MAREAFDLVIIGGGVTGAGCALDAATRGLSVALIEQRDWAAGTSSRSSKLIHGGLRYLELLDFGLVREALREQTLLLDRICPHLLRPLPFLFPLTRPLWQRAYVGTGILLYDLLAGRRALPRHRHLSRQAALSLFPGLRSDFLVGAIQYYDAQVDDARHTLTVARTAARYGAVLATSARAIGFLHEGGRVCGVRFKDLESGKEIDLRCRQVINASGVWTDQIQAIAGNHKTSIRASKGVHLVIPRDRIAGDSGLVLRTERSVLFVVPWKRHWIIGTTDTDWSLDLSHPAASRRDIEYLLRTVNTVLSRPLTTADIEGVYAGLRPLLYGEDEATSKLSREHAVTEPTPGLITVAGGKYTTYRVMAKDAVDAAVRRLGCLVADSCTHLIPLLGAEGFHFLLNCRERIARQARLDVVQVERLLGRYGTLLGELLELIHQKPNLATPVEGAEEYLRAEIHYAASHEGALHLDDVLTRRTRTSIETFDRGLSAAPVVASIMGDVLGWDEATRARELRHYEARVAAERESQHQPDDRTADAARLGAPDVRMGREMERE